jgi:hypothetical protein
MDASYIIIEGIEITTNNPNNNKITDDTGTGN